MADRERTLFKGLKGEQPADPPSSNRKPAEGKELIIVDTFSFFFRNFYGLPPLRAPNGFPTGMLQGLVNFIHKLGELGGDYIVFTLDSDKRETFRKELYPPYKENRPPPPPDLKLQIEKGIELLQKMGFKLLELPGYESDDLIASLVEWGKQLGFKKIKIVSTDKDLCQLIDDRRVVLVDFFNNREIDEEECYRKYGVRPTQFADYLALVGDSSDNIPGVKGIGPKGAAKLLTQFGSLEEIYAHLDQLSPSLRRKLEEGREMAFLSRRLVELRRDLFGDGVGERGGNRVEEPVGDSIGNRAPRDSVSPAEGNVGGPDPSNREEGGHS